MHRVKKIHKLFYLAKKKEKKLGFNDCDCMFPQMLSGLCGLELRWFFLTEYSSLSECHSIKKVHTSPNCLGEKSISKLLIRESLS